MYISMDIIFSSHYLTTVSTFVSKIDDKEISIYDMDIRLEKHHR